MSVNMIEARSMKREKIVQKQELPMTAVAEARAMLCAVPLDLSRGESKAVWLLRVARLFGLAPAKAKRIYYNELKRIDADLLLGMRRRNAIIESTKALSDANRERINELIFSRHELARAGRLDRVGEQASADGRLRAGASGEAGGEVAPEDRAALAGHR